MDKKDKDLLYYLDINSRESLTNLANKLKTSKEVIHYRLNKLEEEGIISQFYTIINLSKFGFVAYKIYFQFQNLSREKENELIETLKKEERIFWIATCSGSWDLIIGSWAKNVIDFNDNILEKILSQYSKYILKKEITITKYNIQWNRRWLSNISNKKETTSVVGGEPQNSILDEKDDEILKILAKNARISIIEISKRIKLNPTTTKNRINKLQKEGIIQSYRITIDLKKFNYGFFKAFVFLQEGQKKNLEKLIQFCRSKENILNVVTCVGPWDFEIEFEVENFEKFNDILKEIKDKFPEIIKNYESVLITSEPRIDFMPSCYQKFIVKEY